MSGLWYTEKMSSKLICLIRLTVEHGCSNNLTYHLTAFRNKCEQTASMTEEEALDLNHRLAFAIVVSLVLIAEQRLETVHLVRPGSDDACCSCKNDCDDHKSGHYRHGDDFSQSEGLT